MYSYTMIQWVFFFYLYCFLGWVVESFYVSLKSRKLVNRGFMRGPFLPLYGSGAIMMLVVSMPFQDNPVLVYVAGCIGATALEYVTGVTMEALFKVRYWDYSQNKFNFQGHICLFTTLAWGFLTILMTEVVHRPIEAFVLSLPQSLLSVMTYALTAGIAADFALSFKAALDLRDVLVRMEKAKEELLHIRARLDALIAAAGEDISGYRESFAEVKESIEEKLEHMKNLAAVSADAAEEKVTEDGDAQKPESRWSGIRRELQELRANYLKNVEERRKLGALRDFFQKALIAAHPSMYSERFKEALEELRQNLKDGTDK
ncbi:MAG: hypothetical protein NC094_13505 [Bacteroidales bacterium]|nr:hypothetical protein [Lachnoclostridium sp.]MCM1384819.1 hypothetical protein [Lachnoclostridium sp.]MCM1466420.1 hypothetical protein [Bacteroidales bacterium]